jgi:ParB-like chromosome segregation protein Spo0J
LIKNKILRHERVPLDGIMFNPKNWRIHPKYQRESLTGILRDVGIVQSVIINERTGNLVDGHLRCQVYANEGETEIDATIVDLSEDEEMKILLTFDPLSALAVSDTEKVKEIMENTQIDDENLSRMLSDTAGNIGNNSLDGDNEMRIREQYMILIDCVDEQQQTELLTDLTEKGIKCRALLS